MIWDWRDLVPPTHYKMKSSVHLNSQKCLLIKMLNGPFSLNVNIDESTLNTSKIKEAYAEYFGVFL